MAEVSGAALAMALGPLHACGAETPWTDLAQHGPFRCRAAFSLASLEALFGELKDLQKELQRTLAVPPASQTVDLYLLADEASHRRLLAGRYPTAPYRRALYVKRAGRGEVYAYRHAELAVDLRHECTHALLHSSLPELPMWLDEGLAEYFEMPDSRRSFGHPHLPAVRWHMRLGMLRPLESLECMQHTADMGGPEYRLAWAWVHFMLHGPRPAHRALVDHLALLRRGEHPGELSARLRQAMPDLDARMVQHFNSWQRA